GVAGLQTIEHRGNERRRPHAETGADEYPDRHARRNALEDEADDGSPISSERHPNADLEATPCDCVRRHAVESNTSKQERRQAEERRQLGYKPFLRERSTHLIGHGSQAECKIWIEVRDGGSYAVSNPHRRPF